MDLPGAVDAWRRGAHREADARLTALLMSAPEDRTLLYARSSVRAFLEDEAGALHDARRCLELHPTWYKAHARLAAVEDARGLKEEALRLLDSGLALCPRSPVLLRERERVAQELRVEALRVEALREDDDGEAAGASLRQETLRPETLVWMQRNGVPDVAPRGAVEQGVASAVRRGVQLLVTLGRQEIRSPSSAAEAISQALWLLAELSARTDEHPRVAETMAQLLDKIPCPSEAVMIRHEAGGRREPKTLERQMETMDVCFFPARLTHVCTPVAQEKAPSAPASISYAAVRTLNCIEIINVPPHTTLCVEHAALESRLAVLVVRLPKWYATRVAHESWIGLAESSCWMVAGRASRMQGIVGKASKLSAGFGALWLWMYPADAHFGAEAKRLRQAKASSIMVRAGTAVHLSRQRLRWEVRHLF